MCQSDSNSNRSISFPLVIPPNSNNNNISTTNNNMPGNTNNASVGYGATDNDDAAPGSSSFDEEHFRFLENKPLTWKQKTHKLLLIAMPILIAMGVLGGTAYFLKRVAQGETTATSVTERHHYEQQDKYNKPETGAVPVVETTTKPIKASSTSNSTSDSSSNIAASCSAYSGCKSLTGLCCPTPEGITLECCHE
mmetsp:Transcript_2879/g.6129  ORF Transcript_2879/g.6129 Transcript_2879/m.6129 type:complete len:194 (+) Transcript_2879:129-710(+)|eukprot:CAMPEP_0168733712 /NCGR_PEP_ID=MMETSP0724-20121128/8435_1 /TAXON_ID=265536 /ORGANISM="Amphiprora sp., Strain CCMP467" /LENGTH=193 /DNA_ID=CAMNT_0008780785 /DNA_START=147 /DNA_END=728 /DNA_ORIENTATION=-